MPKLSTIDEVERAAAEAADDLEMRRAQEAMRASSSTEPVEQAVPADPDGTQENAAVVPVEGGPLKPARGKAPRTAAQEEDFHGLSSTEGMGVGQKALIVVAALVCIAAVLYVVNSWVHFI